MPRYHFVWGARDGPDVAFDGGGGCDFFPLTPAAPKSTRFIESWVPAAMWPFGVSAPAGVLGVTPSEAPSNDTAASSTRASSAALSAPASFGLFRLIMSSSSRNWPASHREASRAVVSGLRSP